MERMHETPSPVPLRPVGEPAQQRRGAAQLPSRVQAQREAMKRTMGEMRGDPAAQAREVLHLAYTVAPLAAGFDKFTDALVDWERYLDPRIARAAGMSPKQFMRMVGVIEMAAGVLVAARPKWGAWVVAGWLGGIIGNLVMQRRYLDVALRDLGLMLGAVALGRLEQAR